MLANAGAYFTLCFTLVDKSKWTEMTPSFCFMKTLPANSDRSMKKKNQNQNHSSKQSNTKAFSLLNFNLFLPPETLFLPPCSNRVHRGHHHPGRNQWRHLPYRLRRHTVQRLLERRHPQEQSASHHRQGRWRQLPPDHSGEVKSGTCQTKMASAVDTKWLQTKQKKQKEYGFDDLWHSLLQGWIERTKDS